jgi:hypothetical protein
LTIKLYSLAKDYCYSVITHIITLSKVGLMSTAMGIEVALLLLLRSHHGINLFDYLWKWYVPGGYYYSSPVNKPEAITINIAEDSSLFL